MDLVVDLHVHTVASGHAYSTVAEIVQAARARGMKLIGLADHGPALPGGPHPYHFGNIKVIPREWEGLEVLCGVEANVIDLEGHLDLEEEYLRGLDFVAAGFHVRTGYPGRTVAENTQAMVAAMRNPWVNWIVHPGNPAFQVDVPTVAAAAAELGVPLEINNTSLTLSRLESRGNCERIARLLAENGGLVILGSDAHMAYQVGELAAAAELAQAAGLKPEQILNSSPAAVKEFLARRRAAREGK